MKGSFRVLLFLALAGVPLLAQQKEPSGAAPAAAEERSFDDSAYRLTPGDVLDIKFMHNPELNEQVQIRPDGFISMPYVGEMNIGSKTVGELIASLTSIYAPVVRTPAFTVQIRNFANR